MSGSHWTQRDVERLRTMRAQNCTLETIGKALGRTPESVKKRLQRPDPAAQSAPKWRSGVKEAEPQWEDTEKRERIFARVRFPDAKRELPDTSRMTPRRRDALDGMGASSMHGWTV